MHRRHRPIKTATMKKIFFALMAMVVAFCAGCNNKKSTQATLVPEEQADAADTTVYGVCGDGTSMHSLQVITDMGDTIDYMLVDADDNEVDVAGGLMCGDRVAVTGMKTDEGYIAQKVINMTSLIGRWTSIDKNFVIEEGGTVSSAVKAETKPWTVWKIFNGQLLLNKDTFDVVTLGADSLALENRNGIFVYKRQLTK